MAERPKGELSVYALLGIHCGLRYATVDGAAALCRDLWDSEETHHLAMFLAGTNRLH